MTDEGIKHMKLHTLHASYNKITYYIENGVRRNK